MKSVMPEQVGLSSERLSRIGTVLQGYTERRQIAGFVTLIARRGRVAHLGCVGLADLDSGRSMQPDSIFRIYSMSKPITAAAVLMLYEEGHFRLDQPVADFIPGFKDTPVCVGGTVDAPELAPQERSMTIRHLLTHTSGLVYPSPEGSVVERLLHADDAKAEETVPEENLEEWVTRLVKVPLAHQPGTVWHYGLSIDVLGYLVEVISGKSFDAFLQERLFAPLGMVDTDFYVPESKLSRFTGMYEPDAEGHLKVQDPVAGFYAHPHRFLSGGGGLVSTIGDYYRFAQMLLNGGELAGERLLGRKTVELMTVNHLPPALLPWGFPGAPALGWGFGLGVKVRTGLAEAGCLGSVGEYGWSGYAGTDYWGDPQEQLIGLIMPQFVGSPTVSYPYQEQFHTLAYQAIID